MTFSGQLYFWRSYFFKLFQSNYFDDTAAISQSSYFFRTAAFLRNSFFGTVIFLQLLFQNSFFFRAKLLQSSLFLRIGSYLGQLLFEAAIFWRKNCLEKKISTEELLFQRRYFCTSSTFSGKLHFGKS